MQIDKNKKRQIKRLQERKTKLQGKHCLNCSILISERLIDKGRSYLYCRKCLTEYKDEVRRNRWCRYYQRKRNELLPKIRERVRQYRKRYEHVKTKKTS